MNKERFYKRQVLWFFIIYGIISFSYFYWFGNYVTFFQEKQKLFIISGVYIKDYFLRPGGILELIGDFITCAYINPLPGALIITLTLILPGAVILLINNKLHFKTSVHSLLVIIPLCLLLFMQTHYYHLVKYNIGFLAVFFYFLMAINSFEKRSHLIVLSLFPVFYYLTGGYFWIFAVMYIIYILVYGRKDIHNLLHIGYLVVTGSISFFVFKYLLFIQPVDQLLFHNLPSISDPRHKMLFYVLTGMVILYPLFGRLLLKTGINIKYQRKLIPAILVVVLTGTVFFLSELYNPQTHLVFQMQKHVCNCDWSEAVKLHEKSPSGNLIGQYYYNVALAETGLLCDRLFFGRQDFGVNSLALPWSQEYLNRGAYFYYAIGLINEAHRWAYESMVVYGYRPENVILLVKTSLINGDYRMARKYVNLIKKSVNYRKQAREFEKLIENPDEIKIHPELGRKMKILPKGNFFVEASSPINNIRLLLNSDPYNKVALDYEMAWMLLSKDIETIYQKYMKMKDIGYSKIPRHIEEAVLVYMHSPGNNAIPEKVLISNSTGSRYDQYVYAYKQNFNLPIPQKEQNMSRHFANTFWFYFHFR
jgi:hypothetical protein